MINGEFNMDDVKKAANASLENCVQLAYELGYRHGMKDKQRLTEDKTEHKEEK